MVDKLGDNSVSVFLTYHDVKTNNPTWTDKMIEDYLALKRDVSSVASAVDTSIEVINSLQLGQQAQINEINDRLGSGQPLTCDTTGFTCDSTQLTCDMSEA